MIGQAWPVADTGYTILELGEINRQTLQLVLQAYLVADSRGNTFADRFANYALAEAAAKHFAAQGLLAKS
jgi:glycosyltransferase A (GT-A) superfamily protein (DUF2064 family)